MTKQTEAMKLALETLEVWKGYMPARWDKTDEQAIVALRQALANEALDRMAENARELGLDYEPAQQKPVAWGVFEGNLHDMFFTETEAVEMAKLKGTHAEVKPLYTRPQAREPLTDEEIWGIAERSEDNRFSFARAIEAAHGITGEKK